MSNIGSGASSDSNATEITSAEGALVVATSPATEQAVAALVEKLRTGRCMLCAGPRLGDAVKDASANRDASASDVAPAIDSGFRALLERLAASVPDVDGEAARALIATRPLAAASLLRRRLGAGFASTLQQLTATPEIPRPRSSSQSCRSVRW